MKYNVSKITAFPTTFDIFSNIFMFFLFKF